MGWTRPLPPCEDASLPLPCREPCGSKVGFMYQDPWSGWQRPHALDFREKTALSCSCFYHVLPFLAFWLVRPGGPTPVWGSNRQAWAIDLEAPNSLGLRTPWRPLGPNTSRHETCTFIKSFPCEPGVSINSQKAGDWGFWPSLYIRDMRRSTESAYSERSVSKCFISALNRRQGKTHCAPFPPCYKLCGWSNEAYLTHDTAQLQACSSVSLTKIIHTLEEAWNSNSLSFYTLK